MIETDVAQAGTSSITHISVAYTKIAMSRCWIWVRPSNPKLSVGRNQSRRKTARTKSKPMDFLFSLSGLNRFA